LGASSHRRKVVFTPGDCGRLTEKNEHRTSNIERPTSNVEWEKMKKQNYDIEEMLLKYSVRIIKNDILQETEKLTKIFVTIIKTAEKKRK
jgi:hypothetical protein